MRPDGTSPEYDKYIIKRYTYWQLVVSERHYYLGRCIAWLLREGNMQRLSSLTGDERDELWNLVLPEHEKTVEKLWKPDHMNYAWLGNDFHIHKGHGHFHLIPRYKSSRDFCGRTFVDEKWGKNYAPTPEADISEGIIFAVRDALKAELN
jgi:diadenosine tetraphosphate (Ap4A) HIT family hydrolase